MYLRYGIFCVALFVGEHLACAQVEPPRLRSVGIDFATQNYHIVWEPSPTNAALISFYRIGHLEESLLGQAQMNEHLDSVSPQTTAYLLPDSTLPCCSPQTFFVGTVPSNNATFPVWTDGYKSMNFFACLVDTCAQSITMAWTEFQKVSSYDLQIDNSFSKNVEYQVFACIGDTFEVAQMQYMGSSQQKTSFTLTGLEGQKKYQFVIAAIYNEGADTSYSNIQQQEIDFPLHPVVQIDSLIADEQQNFLYFTILGDTTHHRFAAEQSQLPTTQFTTFADIANTANHLAHNNPSEAPTYYRIAALNRCNAIVYSSPTAVVLYPTVSADVGGRTLQWNALQYNNNTDVVYRVYSLSSNDTVLLAETRSTEIDDVRLATQLNEDFCYRVRAVVRNSSGDTVFTAQSRTVCYNPPPVWYMPNALQPNNSTMNYTTKMYRNEFAPVSIFEHQFWLHIYNRWGQEVYSGNQPWNGRHNNKQKFVNEDTYIYQIKITFAHDTFEKTGSVSVVFD